MSRERVLQVVGSAIAKLQKRADARDRQQMAVR